MCARREAIGRTNANSETPQTDGDRVFRAPTRAHRRPLGGDPLMEEMALPLVMMVVMVMVVWLAAGHAIEQAGGDAGRRPRKNERARVGRALAGQRAVNAGGAAQRIRRDPISVPAAAPTDLGVVLHCRCHRRILTSDDLARHLELTFVAAESVQPGEPAGGHHFSVGTHRHGA